MRGSRGVGVGAGSRSPPPGKWKMKTQGYRNIVYTCKYANVGNLIDAQSSAKAE